ncbi:OLC1v1010423C1 [Oldenlandia corymbosa var. corymbosa]|uniref:OLC1v1010423C1 n=1 Tax=Oldenlandia corymbosa var. corymbosa TaxID=529605 RepID=A0AAV1DRE5_OLDCO|nr:OLC1v1010423C1 [Oldenlandia corymbosa var. corymbosa]
MMMQVLCHISSALLLSLSFSEITKLDIECPGCQWRSLFGMLESSNKLEDLKIRKVDCITCRVHDDGRWRRTSSKCLSSSLARISVTGLKGLKDEMSMMKYILKHQCNDENN